jgi:hypothetical protein
MENMGDLNWSSVASVLFGGGGATFFVRILIKRAIDSLDEVAAKLEDCTYKLLILENEFRSLQTLRDMVLIHDRKLIELDVRSQKP